MATATELSALVQGGWEAEHAAPFDWAATFGLIGAGLFAAAFLALLARGLLQRRLYRATDVLGEDERAELAAEVADAEKRTTGEIVVVVLERSDRHPGAEWMAGAVAMLLGSVLLAGWLPWEHPVFFFACQAALGAAGFFAARLVPGFKRAFISEMRADEMADEQALQEFYAHGLHRTEGATGILLFVSLLERRVVVLADEGIDRKLDSSYWDATDAAVLDGVRTGSLKRGLANGLRRCADVLAEHAPSSGDDRDEVPNHVIVRAH